MLIILQNRLFCKINTRNAIEIPLRRSFLESEVCLGQLLLHAANEVEMSKYTLALRTYHIRSYHLKEMCEKELLSHTKGANPAGTRGLGERCHTNFRISNVIGHLIITACVIKSLYLVFVEWQGRRRRCRMGRWDCDSALSNCSLPAREPRVRRA